MQIAGGVLSSAGAVPAAGSCLGTRQMTGPNCEDAQHLQQGTAIMLPAE